MTRLLAAKPRRQFPAKRPDRAATSTLDVLTALTLLVAVMSFATPMLIRHSHLLKSQRDYRLALDELSNQIDRLTALPADELPKALEQLVPSPFFAERNPHVGLSGELQPAANGMRLTLKISWSESRLPRAPVSLAAWIFPALQPDRATERSQP